MSVERLCYRPGEVAELLSISRSKTYELLAAGRLPQIKLGSSIRVPADALREFIAREAKNA